MDHRTLEQSPPQAPPRRSAVLAAPRRFRLGLVAGVLGPIGIGCSLLYDLNAEQCSQDADCGIFGDGYTCSAVHVCVAPAGGGGDGGSGGGTAGTGGGDAGPEVCTSNAECMDSNGNLPFVCRASQGAGGDGCVDLTSDECPFVIGEENLRSEDPIIIGAYTAFGDSPPDSVVTANYQLALQEFTREAPGGGLQNGRRKIAMLACDGQNAATFGASFDHLVGVARVPAVIAPLQAADLVTLFDTKGRASGVFFLSPLDADSSLTFLEDEGLVWNILGSAAALAPPFVPLLQRTEAHLRSQQTLPPNIKVALIDDGTQFQKDISDELIGAQTPLSFNGRSLLANSTDGCASDYGDGNDCFLPLEIPASGDAAAYEPAVTALNDFQPNVIIGLTGPALVTVMESIEALWDTQVPRPFYLLGPYLAGWPELGDLVAEDNPSCASDVCLGERLLGINFESARDPALLNSYRIRFATAYQGRYENNYENFYDAAWYMIYALAAAGNVPLTGSDVARGMGLVVRNAPTRRFYVGQSEVPEVLSQIQLAGTLGIQVDGTMGPPDFNPATGARNTLGSAFCVGATGEFMFDVLRYDSSDSSMADPAEPDTCVPAGF